MNEKDIDKEIEDLEYQIKLELAEIGDLKNEITTELSKALDKNAANNAFIEKEDKLLDEII